MKEGMRLNPIGNVELRRRLIESGHEVSNKVTANRGHTYYYDSERLLSAWNRYSKPGLYVTKVIQLMDSDEYSFLNAVIAMESSQLKSAEHYTILQETGQLERPVGEFSPAKSNYYKTEFERYQTHLISQTRKASRRSFPRPFVTNVIGGKKPDEHPNAITLEFLALLNGSYLTREDISQVGNACQKFGLGYDRLQDIRVRFRLANDLIEGRYEPTDNDEGVAVLSIALEVLSLNCGEPYNPATVGYEALRRSVVSYLSKKDNACDDIMCPVDREGLTSIIRQANLLALLGEGIWNKDRWLQEDLFMKWKEWFTQEDKNFSLLGDRAEDLSTQWCRLYHAYYGCRVKPDDINSEDWNCCIDHRSHCEQYNEEREDIGARRPNQC